MRGIEPGMSWTHLIPGFIVAGVGAGLVNVPLASTAVGVVEPARAGMASGINSTLRQVGIATGVAALGAIFSHHASEAARGPRPLVGPRRRPQRDPAGRRGAGAVRRGVTLADPDPPARTS